MQNQRQTKAESIERGEREKEREGQVVVKEQSSYQRKPFPLLSLSNSRCTFHFSLGELPSVSLTPPPPPCPSPATPLLAPWVCETMPKTASESVCVLAWLSKVRLSVCLSPPLCLSAYCSCCIIES